MARGIVCDMEHPVCDPEPASVRACEMVNRSWRLVWVLIKHSKMPEGQRYTEYSADWMRNYGQ